MNKKSKIILIVLVFLLVFIISFFITYFSVSNYHENKVIKEVSNIFNNSITQNEIENITNVSDLSLQIDGQNIVGTIKIDKINFEGLVYEGTSMKVLKKGVGHFESSPLTKGNICLAAHNTNKFWKNLHELTNGDIILYTNVLGTKKYAVFNIKQIEETDLNCLQNTQDNILTLITCVKNKPNKRLCVQAIAGE